MSKNIFKDTAPNLTHWSVFWANSWVFFIAIGISALVAVLSLTMPMFILLIYDRVLNSRSLETLWAICIIAIVTLVAHGFLDYSRRRTTARFAGNLQADLEGYLVTPVSNYEREDTIGGDLGTKELDSLRAFSHSGGILCLVDAIWVPLYVFALYIINPLLGYLTIAACIAIAGIHYLGKWVSKYRWSRASVASQRVKDMGVVLKDGNRLRRNQIVRKDAISEYLRNRSVSRRCAIWANDMAVAFQVGGATLRTMQTILMMTLGASLVLKTELTIGGMVASVVLLNRVFSPFLGFIQVLPALKEARENWKKLGIALERRNLSLRQSVNVDSRLPALIVNRLGVSGDLDQNSIVVTASFKVLGGQMVEITGASCSGKTLLAEALAGIRPLTNGKVSYYGVPYTAISPLELGCNIGYIPENPVFFNGTIAENIAGYLGCQNREEIERAGQLARAHIKIIDLPAGYDTRISELGVPLAKGLREELILARALFSNPSILVVDEPGLTLMELFKDDAADGVASFLNEGGAIVVLSRACSNFPSVSAHYQIENNRLISKKDNRSQVLKFQRETGEQK